MSFSDISIQELASAFMVLFAVIDITGAVPIINDIQNKGHKISAIKAALASYILLVAFLFVGDGLLNLFSVDISSFAVAGSLVIFVLVPGRFSRDLRTGSRNDLRNPYFQK